MWDSPQASDVFLLPGWIVLVKALVWADSMVDWELGVVMNSSSQVMALLVGDWKLPCDGAGTYNFLPTPCLT